MKKIKTIGLRRPRVRFVLEIPLDLVQRHVVVRLGVKWTDHFFRHEMVSGSMRSWGQSRADAPAHCPRGVAQYRKLSQIYRLERGAGRRIIAPRRMNSAHFHQREPVASGESF